MRLIERASYLEQLQSLLRQAADGSGSVVLLEGEAGAGKSSLTAAFSRTVPAGTHVLYGACENFGTAEPLGPLRDMARDAGWTLANAFGGNWIALFSGILGLLNETGATTLLVIEDIHWADDATLNLIRYLGRRIRHTGILLVITARNDDTTSQARLRQLLADIPPAHWLRIAVPALTRTAVLDLAGERGLDGEAIFHATGGNAYFVTELVEAGESERLPATIRDAVLARADTLSVADRDALAAASISPDAFVPELIEAICGAAARSSLETCIASGLLVPSGAGLMFRHEIARQAIEQSLPPLRRRALNGEALAFFRSTKDASIAQMVHHANEAQDIAAILELAPQAAAEAARLSAHRQAVRHYELALAHAAALGKAERAVLYESYAFECHLIGQVERAIAAQKHAVDLHRELADLGRVGDNLRWLSRLSYLAGHRKDAERFGNEAVDILETVPAHAERAMAYSNLSQLGMLAGDVKAATEYGDRAIALLTAGALDRPDILCHALNNVGTAIYHKQPDRARALLDRALAIALDHDFQEHAARAFTNRGWMERRLHSPGIAQDFLDRGIAYCVERDIDTWRDYMRGELSELLLSLGRWQEAAMAAQAVVDNQNAPALSRYPALAALATLRTRHGEPADDLLAEMARFLENGLEFQRLSAHAELMAERAWLGLADRTSALQRLCQAYALAVDDMERSTIYFWAYMLGERGLAPDRLECDPAVVDMMEGRWQAAAKIWDARGASYLSAIVLLQGDPEAQYRALTTLEALGATAVADHARAVIRQRNGRVAARGPRASTRANSAGLTRREMDVLRLIEEGRTNIEIGGRLFVSAKTVDHHISSILAKLNAKSRGEAAALGRRLGLLA